MHRICIREASLNSDIGNQMRPIYRESFIPHQEVVHHSFSCGFHIFPEKLATYIWITELRLHEN